MKCDEHTHVLHLVDTLEWWDSSTLSLIEGCTNNLAVLDVHIRGLGIVLESESVLHPVLIITLY